LRILFCTKGVSALGSATLQTDRAREKRPGPTFEIYLVERLD
jgi:hypothetical protein